MTEINDISGDKPIEHIDSNDIMNQIDRLETKEKLEKKDKSEKKEKHANTPPIIKKIKKGGHGHHGGSRKIAYADFVTAMMAFFLLMWLVASLNKAQRPEFLNILNNL